MPRPSFPRPVREFEADFASEESCQQYLEACRWPDGFACPRCSHPYGYELVNQRRRQCAKCRHRVSLTFGTILHGTKIPLLTWFWAACLMTTNRCGISALFLQRQLQQSQRTLAPILKKVGASLWSRCRFSGRNLSTYLLHCLSVVMIYAGVNRPKHLRARPKSAEPVGSRCPRPGSGSGRLRVPRLPLLRPPLRNPA